mgnify:CR=1 FL=1
MKKKIYYFIVISISFTLLSCAKPEVVEVILPSDNNLNCEELNEELAQAIKLKQDAEYAKEGTGGNIARVILFWPAWAKSLSNADKAVQAANDRRFHLEKLMRKKKCKTSPSAISKREIDISSQLWSLKELYDSGALTSEEYKKAKKRLLD